MKLSELERHKSEMQNFWQHKGKAYTAIILTSPTPPPLPIPHFFFCFKRKHFTALGFQEREDLKIPASM